MLQPSAATAIARHTGVLTEGRECIHVDVPITVIHIERTGSAQPTSKSIEPTVLRAPSILRMRWCNALRRVKRRRHRHDAARTALRRSEHAVTNLLIDGAGARDENDILSPTQRLHFANAQSASPARHGRRVHSRPSFFAD